MAKIFNFENRKQEGIYHWIMRFIKFNIIGFTVFLISTVIYSALFSFLGFWTWLFANAAGSVLQFSLINYFNSKKNGNMFSSCEQKSVHKTTEQTT